MFIVARIIALALQLHAAAPASLTVVGALQHARLAASLETEKLPAETILGIAAVESDFDSTAVSKPHGDRAPYYCGVMQTAAATDEACHRQRTLDVAYQLGVRELEQWLSDRRCAGDIHCALLGHGCGNAGLETGTCNSYPERVLAFARRLH